MGIFDQNLKKALTFDPEDLKGVAYDIAILKKNFAELMEQAQEEYMIIFEGKTLDKAVGVILDYFMDEKERQKYYQFFRKYLTFMKSSPLINSSIPIL